MSDWSRFSRLGAACLFSVVLALPRPCAAAPAGGRLDACGALTVEPELAGAWPDGKGVRPGATVLSTEGGLGCRFTLPAQPGGGPVLVEARLTRPTGAGGQTAVDRWYVPVRRGEPAAVTYGFFPPGQATPGEWRLELYADGVRLAGQTFTVLAAGPPESEPVPAATAPDQNAPVPAPPATAPGPAAPAEAPAPGQAASAPAAAAPPAVPSPAATKAEPVPPAPAPIAPPQKSPPPPVKAASSQAPSPAAKAPPAALAGFYALQTGLFADLANAEGQAARLRARGLPACVSVEGQGAGRRYRVLAGRFGQRQGAAAARGEVKAATRVTPLVFAVDPARAAGLRCH